jgi:Flp pilus assembly pilin Flp
LPAVTIRATLERMNRVIQFLGSLSDREEGQTLTEYAVILSLISVASIAFLTPLSDAINALYTTVTGAF